MFNTLKRMLVVSLVFNIALSPQVIFANDYMTGAKQAVKAQHANVDSYVSQMVMTDINKLVKRLIGVQGFQSAELQKLVNMDAEIVRLSNEFSTFLKNSSALDTISKEQYNEFVVQVSDLSKQAFDLSWLAPTAAIYRDEYISTVDLLLHDFSETCEIGKNDISFNTSAYQSVPPPPVSYSLYVSGGVGGINDYQYRQENFNYTKEDGGWAKVANLSGETFGYSTSLYYSLGTSSAMTTAVGWVAVSSLIVAAVATLVVTSVARGKYYKVLKDYYTAESYRIKNSWRSEDINRLYKEKCSEMVGVLTKAQERLVNLSSSKQQTEINRYRAEEAKYEKLESDLTKYNLLVFKSFMLNGYLRGTDKCIKVTSYDRNKKDKCQIVDGKLHPPPEVVKGVDISALIIEEPKTETLNAMNAEIMDYEKNNSQSDLIDLAIHKIIGVFISQEQIFSSINENVFIQLSKLRIEALRRVSDMYGHLSKQGSMRLRQDLEISQRFYNFKDRYVAILRDVFELIWGKKNKSQVLVKLNSLQSEYRVFNASYLHISEVRTLNESIQWLTTYVNGTFE